MKNCLLILAFLTVGFSLQAQVTLPKADASSLLKDFIKPPAIGDVPKTTSGIMSALSGLGLSDTQKPKLSELISGFLTDKKGIAGLADKNPGEYIKKFNPLQQGLFGKMKGLLGAPLFDKFLKMKPSGKNIAGNLLSHLFF